MSAFDRIDDIPTPAPDRHGVFLDFDGTLVGIAPTPDAIVLPTALPALLARLHARYRGGLTLISGRSVADVTARLPPDGWRVIGSHGAELRDFDSSETRAAAGAQNAPPDAAVRAAQAWIAEHPGTLLEQKPAGFVLHFRAVPEAEKPAEGFARGLAARFPPLEVQPSKMAWELRPAGIGKGGALRAALANDPVAQAVMIGDDDTDEAAMEVALESGGLAIKVGSGETSAPWRLEGPEAVLALLERWAA